MLEIATFNSFVIAIRTIMATPDSPITNGANKNESLRTTGQLSNSIMSDSMQHFTNTLTEMLTEHAASECSTANQGNATHCSPKAS